MKEQAIGKLRAEMAEKPNESYIQLIGNYLIADVEANPDHAAVIMNEDKTISGSLEAMQRFASNKRRGKSYVVLTPEEGFSIVMGYFSIYDVKNPVDANQIATATATAPTRPPAASSAFDVSLDDLLQEEI